MTATETPSRPAAATKEAGKLRSWEAGKKHENCVRFSACGGIMVRKKIAGKPLQRIDTAVMKIKCCNKNKKLKDCSTENTEVKNSFLCDLCDLCGKKISCRKIAGFNELITGGIRAG